MLVTLLPWGGKAHARFNPLMTISQQVENEKANILIMLDTSGSMLGLPGGTFHSSSEVGVDCDGGDRCRVVPTAATCSGSGVPCGSDDECRQGRCEDGGDPCLVDLDCPQSGAACSATGVACQYNSDCAPASGTCSQGGACSTVSPCPSLNTCEYTGQSCPTAGGLCANTCAGSTAVACTSHSSCVTADTGATVSGLLARWKFDGNLTSTPAGLTLTAHKSNYTPAYVADRLATASRAYQGTTGGNFLHNATSATWNTITNTSGFSGAAWASFAGWLDLGVTSTTNPQYLALVARYMQDNASARTNNWRFALKLDNGAKLICFGHDRTTPATEVCWNTSSLPLNLNEWHHYAFTWANDVVVLYVDGKAKVSGVLALNPQSNTGAVTVGATLWDWTGPSDNSFTAISRLNGALDELRLYNRQLTTSEVQELSQICPTTNTCIAGAANVCSVPQNVCTATVTNRCVGGNTTSLCVRGGSGSAPLRMCQIGLQACVLDSQCTAPGDACVPSVSRAVAAKRALSSVLYRNQALVNFGLMTFTQSGYFPYYPVTGSTSVTQTDLMIKDRLEFVGCFPGGAPAATCATMARTYTLAASSNSRYRVRAGADDYVTVDQNWCGLTCTTSKGMGIYEGSYYAFTTTSATYNERATPIVRSTYEGKIINVGGVDHVYFEPKTNYNSSPESGTNRAPIKADVQCGGNNPCGTTCGARWDPQLAPFLDPTGASSSATVNAIAANLEKAWVGGLMFWGRTPTGCALKNDGAPDEQHSAYHYLAKLKSSDALSCRRNHVLLLTDGEPNGPGDNDTSGNGQCNAPACAADDPAAAGCRCRSVLAAQALRKDLGVATYVVAFAGDIAAGNGGEVTNNIARAGGTKAAYVAHNEFTLVKALQAAVLDALKGSYATSPPTPSSAVQLTSGVQLGSLVLESRVDFPSWGGHLHAYDPQAGLSWDAAAVSFDATANPDFWKQRRVWTWDGTQMVRVAVNSSGAVTNKAQLRALGLGSSDAEAERMARWMLGDPAMKNPAVLGGIINSTPIDVGPVGNSPLPGGGRFYTRYKDRPNLIYVGADDGMLHAFFTRDTTINGTTYRAGSEAFAFIPRDMLPVVARLYGTGGQLPAPQDHVFGLASSPKVKNVCVSSCTDDATAVWKTLLFMSEGPGGNESFVVDITDTFDESGVASPPLRMTWHTADVSEASRYDGYLGQTFSVPAFVYGKGSTLDDYRVLFTSGYGGTGQGTTLISAQARNGRILDAQTLNPPFGCAVPYTALTDVATARNHAASEQQQTVAGYFGDTWGNLWRYVPTVGLLGNTLATGTISPVLQAGCDQPLHFSPTVVQLDRDGGTGQPGAIYLVQVTNSPLDDETRWFGRSRMIIRKDLASGGLVVPDLGFGTAGQITLEVGGTDICSGTPCVPLPEKARPLATPLAALKADGSGFVVFSVWYVPATCTKGETFFTAHEVSGSSDTVTQRLGVSLANEPVTGIVVVGGKLYYIDSQRGLREIPGTTLALSARRGGDDGYRRTSWVEVP
jgi:hypothetical protein